MDNYALGKIGYGLYILTSAFDGKDNGCIINTVCQLTVNPDKVMVCVNNDSYTCEMIKNSGIFNVSILKEETPYYVFEHFGFVSGREKQKFEKTDNLFRSENGVYVVPKYANSYFSGKVCDTIDLGTHTMFVADVTSQYVFSDDATVTYDYYHNNIKPKPNKTSLEGYRCQICGYIHEGDSIPDDFICPICKHGVADFVKI